MPTPTPPQRTSPGDLTGPSTDDDDIVAQLIAESIVRLGERLDVSREAITLVEVEAATWTGVDYGCGDDRLPGIVNVEIPGYRLVFEVGGERYAYHTDTEGTVRACDRSDLVVGQTAEVLSVDPVAAELVALARRRIVQTDGVEPDLLTLVDVQSVRWPDASLGCPLPDANYATVAIDGYRILLEDETGQRFFFHTSFEQVFECPAERVVLPGPTPAN